MKNMNMIITVCAVLAVAGFAVADDVWCDYDEASPLVVKYNGTETATIQVAAGSVVQVTDGTTTTTLLADITLATLAAALRAAEDDEGDKEWSVKYWAGIAADTVSTNDLIVVAANAVTKEADFSIKWDVSNQKHYDAVVQPGVGTITDIIGEPAGTGDATVSVYVGGERRFYQTIVSPTYVLSATSTVNVANATINLGDLIDLGAGIRVGASEIGFVRCERTTATTGGIGASVSRP